ncbi:hypothetical protein [Streptomyces sp. CC219B]|uniref:hypothetical protein n=1 Tax=Streptomyces sp. CC219B TaxID=3044574 RepID=UPI0024A9F360|nr:hypothetical protein [Streptomyces sp. CC219B]
MPELGLVHAVRTIGGLHLDLVSSTRVHRDVACAVPVTLLRPDRTRDEVHPVPGGSGMTGADDLLDRARAIDVEHRNRKGRPASIRYLKKHLKVGQPKAELIRAALNSKDTST